MGSLNVQDLGANIVKALKVSTCKTNMVARYDRTIDIWKGVLKNSFYVMESSVSSNYTRNIHKSSTPKKEVNRRENTVGKIAKRRLQDR